MKKIILLPLLALSCLSVKAQDSTGLYQNFNSGCDSVLDLGGTYNKFPPGWSAYSVIGQQDWKCETAYGVGNSPCMHINGYQAGASNDDENWLLTPVLDLHSYAASVYLNFSATYYYAGDSLHVMISHDYVPGTAPNFNNPDSTIYHWVELTHTGVMLYDTFYKETGVFDNFQCDLTADKSTPCVIGFKYTSNTINASVWDLDSVTTSGVHTSEVSMVASEKLPVQVNGIARFDDVNVSFDVPAGNYEMGIYDLVGKKLYSTNIKAQGGNEIMHITDVNLNNGMYLLRIHDNNSSGVTKFIVQ
jgi:hypothetical protein